MLPPAGGFKLWECTIDLIETLRREMQDGHLAFRGKDVLELGAGHGLPGILTLLKVTAPPPWRRGSASSIEH